MRNVMGLTGLLLMLVLGAITLIAEESSTAPEPKPGQLTGEQLNQAKKLITKLGANDWREREQATDALIKMGRVIVPLVKEALENPDAEIRMRAKWIMEKINSFIVLQKWWGQLDPEKKLSEEERKKTWDEITKLLEKVKTQENLSESLQKSLQKIFFLRIDETIIILWRMRRKIIGGKPVIVEEYSGREIVKHLEEQYARLTRMKTEKTREKETLLKDIDEVKKALKEDYEKLEFIKYKELSQEDQETLLGFIQRLCGIDEEFLDNYQPEKPRPPAEEKKE